MRQFDRQHQQAETAQPSSSTRGWRQLAGLATTGHLVAAQVVMAVASLLVNVLSARTMGPAGRGNLALLLQIAYLANMIAMAGIDRSYPATALRRPDLRTGTADTVRLVAPSAAVVLAVVAPVVFLLGSDGPAVLASVTCVAATATLVLIYALRTGAIAAGTARLYLLATVVGQASLVVAAVMLTAAGVSSADLWLLAYVIALGSGAATAWLILRHVPRTAESPSPNLVAARRLGLRLLPAAVAGMIMLRADRLMLPWLGSYEQLGLYIVIATVAEFVIWPVQSYVDAQAPHWHRLHLAGELGCAPPLLVATGYGLVATVALLVAGQLLVVPVFGAAYLGSVDLILPLALGAACYGVGRVAVGLSIAAGRARAAIAADVPAMALALIGYLVLIPKMGAMGAAVVSAVSYGVGALIAVLLCLRTPGMHARRRTVAFDPPPVTSPHVRSNS